MKPDNRLFRFDRDAINNACLNYAWTNLEAICHGYLKAAEALADHVITTGNGQDTLVYPIAFLYRHFVELRLKEAIEYGGRILHEDVTVPQDHRLLNLWHIAKRFLARIEPAADKKSVGAIERGVRDLDRIDPESVSFRYSRTKKGKNPLEGLRYINIRVLRDEMKVLTDLLEGLSCMLHDYFDAVCEMEADARES